ncbi:YcaO-like family protein [Pseudomonas sp.]|uniref:YcaO-like family protein n=1 Tax=Pseudomonas sp. TaxID=306 RepID=UPI0028AF4920|nr:YcaO-like family protein [Pseudomonas sp.]
MFNERELDVRQARHRLDHLLQVLALEAALERHGEHDLVATCQLYDAHYQEVSCGAGKGLHCMVGALAESIEHYFMERSAPVVVSSDQVLASLAAHDDGLLKSLPKDRQLPCFEFKGLHSDEQIFVPAVMVAPSVEQVRAIENTDVGYLAKYASNSGMALGCTRREALLHAMNEAIERHALSMYYLGLCGLAPLPRLYRPSPSFLEETFVDDRSLHASACQLDIFLTHDFFDVPFCIAVSDEQQRRPLCTIGSGCSLSPHTALYRAVTEQLQSEQLYSATEVHEDHTAKQLLNRSSRLAALVRPVPPCAVDALHPAHEKRDVAEQIEFISNALQRSTRPVFQRTLFEQDDLATVLQVYIPGLERFHLSRAGIPVSPQSAFNGQQV